MSYTEDTLVQQTTADDLGQQLGWRSVLAWNNEEFGPDGLLGRESDRDIVLTRVLRERLEAFKLASTCPVCQRAISTSR